jgi:CRP-like cAMP-binding protein
MDLPIDTLLADPIESAFAGNRLLATLTDADQDMLRQHVEVVDLHAGQAVLRSGDLVTRTLFPIDSLTVSMIVELSGGRSVEVASIGKEGAVGGIVSCGSAPVFTNVVVQIPGRAAAIPMKILEAAKQSSPHIRNLFCRYSDFLLAQVMQSVACNAFHPIESRAARWLLHASDRVEDERLPFTQESLAGLLGVQRTTVNAVARLLQEQDLISYRRGAIQVRDRQGLTRVACECYQSVEDHFSAILGSDRLGSFG